MVDHDNDELSLEELEDVAGGLDTNNGCTVNGNCVAGCGTPVAEKPSGG